MATSDSKAQITITAVDQFSRIFKSAKDQAEGVGQGIDKLKAAIGGALGIFATGALAQGIKSTVDGIAALDDASQKTGASVENLSKIRNIARDFNMPFAEIESVLPKMIRGLQGVDEETKGAGLALKTLGIEARTSNGSLRDSGELFEDVAKKLSQYADDGDKVALVQALLGKEGAKLIPFLNDYAENLDRASTVTAKQAKEAADLQDALSKMSSATQDMKEKWAIEALPVLRAVTDIFVDMKKQSAGLGQESGARTFAESIAKGFAYIADGARFVWAAFKTVGYGIAGLAVESVNAFDAIVNATTLAGRAINAALTKDWNAAREATQAFNDLKGNWRALGGGITAAFDDSKVAFGQWSEGLISARLNAKLAGTEIPANLRAIDNAILGEGTAKKAGLGDFGGRAKALEEAAKEAKKFAEEFQKLRDKITGADTGVDADFGKNITTLSDALKRGLITFAEYSELTRKYAGQQKVTQDALKLTEEREKALAELREKQSELVEKQIESLWDQAEAITKGNDELRKEIATMGLSERQINERNIALLEGSLAMYESGQAASEMTAFELAHVESLKAQIAGLRERNGLIDGKQMAVNAKEAREAFDAQWRRVGDDLTEWIMGGMRNTKDMLKRMFADLVLRPIISPIGQGIGGALQSIIGGGGGGIGALFGGGGGGLGGLMNGGFGGLAGGVFGSIGTGLMGAGNFVGGALGNFLGSMGGGIAGGFGGIMANLAGGFSGLASGAIASGLGQMLGAVVPVIGPILAIASMLGLGKDKKGFKFDNAGTRGGSDGRGGGRSELINSALGIWDFAGDFKNETVKGFIDRIKGLDDIIAKEFLSDETLGIVRDRLQNIKDPRWFGANSEEEFKRSLEGASKQFLQERYGTAFEEINANMAASIKNFAGSADELIGYIEDYIKVTKLVAEAQDAAKLAAAGFTDELKDIADARDNAQLFALRQQQTAAEKLLATASGTEGLMGNLLQGMTGLRSAALAFMDQVAQVRANVTGSTENLIRDLRMSIMDDPSKYAFLQNETDSLFARAMNSTNPLEIQRLYDRILGNVSASQGLLTDEQRRVQVPEQIARLEELQARIDARLNDVGRTAQDQLAATMELYSKKLEDVAKAMLDAATKNTSAADKNDAAADKQVDAANTPKRIEFYANVPGTVTYSEVGG